MVYTKIDMDNGSFPLAKDALRVLAKTKLSGAHRAIIDVIWLETYGWYDESSLYEPKIKKRKISARISSQVFEEETCMDKSSISRKVKELVNWNVILRDKNTSPFTYSFNVNADQWDSEIFRDTTVYRTVNSLQDSKQEFTEQSTDNLQDSQQVVDCTVNSLQPEQPEIFALEPPLNNTLNNTLNNLLNNPYKEIHNVIFNHWKDHKIVVHKELSEEMIKAIDKAAKQNTIAEIKDSIDHYSIMLKDQKYQLCSYVWALDTFLTRKNGYRLFLTDGEKWINYKNWCGNRGEAANNGQRSGVSGKLDGAGEKKDRLALRAAQCQSHIRSGGEESG